MGKVSNFACKVFQLKYVSLRIKIRFFIMKKSIITIITVVCCLATIGCGRSDKAVSVTDAGEVVEVQQSQLEEALSAGNLKQASVMADSMSLFVDDFTPEQTVQVLTAFVSIHNDASKRRETRRDLETLRKYVDVYDIALSVNPKDTRAAFKKAMGRNPELDFDSIAKAFREKLNQYDSMQDGSLAGAKPAEADTVAKTDSGASAPKGLPLELLPAE